MPKRAKQAFHHSLQATPSNNTKPQPRAGKGRERKEGRCVLATFPVPQLCARPTKGKLLNDTLVAGFWVVLWIVQPHIRDRPNKSWRKVLELHVHRTASELPRGVAT
eukprot:1161496-Pelagomonas_calceolata.AAC.5